MNNEAEMIKKRDLIWLIVLSGITFGIYGFYWTYKLAKDVNTICEGDENETSGLLKLIILSIITLGIYGVVWLYMLGDRLHDNAKRYGLEFKESGGTVVLWSVLGAIIVIGPLIATHIIIKNTNALASRYNKKNFANLMEQDSSNENQETHFESEKELSPQPQRQKLVRTEEKKKLPVGIIAGVVLGLCVVIAIATFIRSSNKSPKSVAASETITESQTPSEPNKNSKSVATNEIQPTEKSPTESKTFTDSRDNQMYKTITIGNQTWIAQNLNYNVQGSKCYGNDESNCQIYGRLYNWSAATKACPSGWHLPSNSEWDILYRSVDGTSGTESPYKSETAGKYLKAKSGWNEGGNGTDNYGFAALPGGLGNSNGSFFSLGNYGNWWSSTEYDGSKSYNHFKSYKHDNAGWETEAKNKLFSVRCLKD